MRSAAWDGVRIPIARFRALIRRAGESGRNPLLPRRQDGAPAQSAGDRGCRYISRPPVAGERLALTASGDVRYALKTSYRDGTTHIVLEPLDLMARLAAPPAGPRS
ncbi:MAG: transposase [Steroidobacteraceae bacterium]|nr:transposase [Steroidobacteraceae bacterium]MBP7615628.1 transposase [Steroidobacteraceae bacterium]